MNEKRWQILAAVCAAAGLAASCVEDLDTTRQGVQEGTFGETIYREACQRVSWTAQLEEQAEGKRDTLDVNGSVYGPVCKQNAPAPADAPERLKAIQGQRSILVAAVDQILPASILNQVEAFLEAITALSDDGTMEDSIGKMGTLLANLRDDDQFTAALAHLSGRTGYRPLKGADLVRTFVGYPKLDDLLDKVLGAVLDKDDNPSPELTALLTALSAELRAVTPVAAPQDDQRTLKVALDLLLSTNPDFAQNTPRPLTRRDYRGIALVATDGSGNLPAPFVDNDGDGLADVDGSGRFVGANGQPLPIDSPFPRAGVPDVGTRDALGRSVDQAGNPVYQYVDLDPTFAAALTRESQTLLDPKKDNALGLLYGASALMGPRAMQTKMYTDAKTGQSYSLTYNGFATEDAALLDLSHAFVQLLGDPAAPQTLQAARTLLTKYEDQTSRAVAALLDAHDRGKNHPEAQIPESSTLYDDLIPIIVRVLRISEREEMQGRSGPNLAEDVMNALEDPHTKGLSPMMARQMIFADHFVLNQSNQTVSGSWSTPVDRTQPDSDWNRSVMQRMLHLVHDANGAQFCNKDHATATVLGIQLGDYKPCAMFEVDDLGLFFILAMADHSITDDTSRPETRHAASFREQITDSTLRTLIPDNGLGDTIIQGLAGINGFTRFPTPPAGARSLFLDPQHQSDFMRNSTDPITCTDGDRFLDVHNDSIFAWESTLPNNPSGYQGDTFYDAIKPLVNAFARHDECVDEGCTKKRNAAKILVDLMSVLHEHWGSAQSSYFGHSYQSADRTAPRFSTGDGAVTYEPLTAEVLANADLVPATINLAPVLRTMTTDGTPNTPYARPFLVKTLEFLFDSSQVPSTLAYRDGTTTAVRNDGQPAGQVTPYYLMADAFKRKRAAVAAAPQDQRDSWNTATSTMVDELLTVETVNGVHRFKNRGTHGMTAALLDMVLGRLAAHDQAGDRTSWAETGLTADLTRMTSSPVFSALADLTARLEANPDAKAALYDQLSYLVDQAQSDAAFQTALTALADNAQLFLDDPDMVPVAHALGTAVDPDRGAVQSQIKMLRKARRLDPACGPSSKCTLTTLLGNLYKDIPNQPAPASQLADAIAAVDRATPGTAGDYTQADYRAILDRAQSFLSDEQRGFLRFVHIVQSRRYTPQ